MKLCTKANTAVSEENIVVWIGNKYPPGAMVFEKLVEIHGGNE